MELVIFGIVLPISGSIFGVDTIQALKEGNDAGAMKFSAATFVSGGVGVLVRLYYISINWDSARIQIVELILRWIVQGMVYGFAFTWLVSLIVYLPVKLLYFLCKHKLSEQLEEAFLQIITAIAISLATTLLSLEIVLGK